MINYLRKQFLEWLNKEPDKDPYPLCDFDRIRYELRPCDVLLIEGKSRVSEVIKLVTQSSWSHACLYIGRVHDIDDISLRKIITDNYRGEPDEQLVIEGMLGSGIIVTPLSFYKDDHIRICRPRGISRQDSQRVITYAIRKLGKDYDVRQIFDLFRFFFPWSILPRRWRSSLFEHDAGQQTRTVCSTLIADAYQSVNFPILPEVRHTANNVEFHKQNPRLCTPRDFDYSPFFEIIKYPISYLVTEGMYDRLPWKDKKTVAPGLGAANAESDNEASGSMRDN